MTSPRKSSCSPIPGFRSWLRAFILVISLIPIGIIGRLTLFPSFVFLVAFVLLDSDEVAFMQIKIFLLIGWLAFAGVLIPVFVLGHIHQLLWGEPDPKLPGWMPNRKSQREGFWDWFVSMTSTFVIVFSYVNYRNSSPREFRGITEEEAQYLIGCFFVLSAYLYHIGLHLQIFFKNTYMSIQTFFKKTYVAIRHWLDTV